MGKDISPEKFKPHESLWFKFILPVISKTPKLKINVQHGFRLEISLEQLGETKTKHLWEAILYLKATKISSLLKLYQH